jgi:hypothetical protein
VGGIGGETLSFDRPASDGENSDENDESEMANFRHFHYWRRRRRQKVHSSKCRVKQDAVAAAIENFPFNMGRYRFPLDTFKSLKH